MDWVERFVMGLVACTVLLLIGVIGIVVMDSRHDGEGVVTNKYYDDPDLVCAKVCTISSECWVIVIDGQPWYEDGDCVSEEQYRSIEVGDYHIEGS